MAAVTELKFQHDAKLLAFDTAVTAFHPLSALSEANQALFKTEGEPLYVVVTEATIFHPQGGGQPTDVGTIKSRTGTVFDVVSVRMDAEVDGQVLHCGHFSEPKGDPSGAFQVGETVTQSVDGEKRLLYSRLHTAGHVLGAAVRALVEKEVPGFDELKASHFPKSAGCEFMGLIDGKWKDPIQKKVDEYVQKALPVEIEWWDADDFKQKGLQRLLPENGVPPPGGKWRVVNIVGADAYPCGGTHVDTTDLCGKTNVTKIKRQKGISRVSYNVNE